VDADLKFVTVDVGAFGKQRDGGAFRNSALCQSLETRSLKVPEDTVLPHSEITLRHIFVGDEAYLLTWYNRTAEEHQAEVEQYLITDCRVHDEL
jgi:hypothetical protein